jgi:hypothetical protein
LFPPRIVMIDRRDLPFVIGLPLLALLVIAVCYWLF